jgi:hypothetical protein
LWLPGDFFHVRDHFIEAFGLLGELCLVYEGIAIHFDYWGGFVDEEMMLVVFILCYGGLRAVGTSSILPSFFFFRPAPESIGRDPSHTTSSCLTKILLCCHLGTRNAIRFDRRSALRPLKVEGQAVRVGVTKYQLSKLGTLLIKT